MDDNEGIAASRLDDHRALAPPLHRVLQRLADGGVRPRSHETAEAVDIGLQHAEHLDAHGPIVSVCLAPGPAVADDVQPVDALQITRIDPADHVRQDRVHQVVGGPGQHAVGLERRLAGPQEALHRFAADPVVVHVAEEAGPVKRAEHVLGIRPSTVPREEVLHLLARQDVAGQPVQESFEVEIARVGRDLG